MQAWIFCVEIQNYICTPPGIPVRLWRRT